MPAVILTGERFFTEKAAHKTPVNGEIIFYYLTQFKLKPLRIEMT